MAEISQDGGGKKGGKKRSKKASTKIDMTPMVDFRLSTNNLFYANYDVS